jgi:hypothetical protein
MYKYGSNETLSQYKSIIRAFGGMDETSQGVPSEPFESADEGELPFTTGSINGKEQMDLHTG